MSVLGDVSAFPDVLRTGWEPLVPLVGLQWAMARARVHSLPHARVRSHPATSETPTFRKEQV